VDEHTFKKKRLVSRGVSRAAEPPPPPPMTEKILRFSSRRRRRCLKQLIKFSAAAADV
jgi:hypothetical protein